MGRKPNPDGPYSKSIQTVAEIVNNIYESGRDAETADIYKETNFSPSATRFYISKAKKLGLIESYRPGPELKCRYVPAGKPQRPPKFEDAISRIEELLVNPNA